MKFSPTEGSLPDVNVWLALCAEKHQHHHSAVAWLSTAATPIYFCRVTQMSLLRLLTNRKVMQEDVLTPAAAVAVYKALLADSRVTFGAEPPGLEERWLAMMGMIEASGSAWTDSYLAAFAAALGVTLVSYDAVIGRWPGVHAEILTGDPTD